MDAAAIQEIVRGVLGLAMIVMGGVIAWKALNVGDR